MNTYIKSTCFLFFFIVQFAYSQEYVPFPTDSTVWNEGWSSNDGVSQTGSGIELFYLFGDTVINNLSYSLLYTGWYPYSPDVIPPEIAETEFVGLIREEDKRVYFTQKNVFDDALDVADEEVLYDFNLNVGDTITHCFNHPVEGLFAVVQNIDSIQILDGSYRKRYEMWSYENLPSPWSTYEIIEGIGSSNGLLFNCGEDGWHYSHWLNCVGTTDENTYHNGWSPLNGVDGRCFDTVINVESPIYQPLSLHPNPTTGIVRLSEPMYDVHLSVYSSIGQKVLDERAFNGSMIDLNGLASGVYFVVMLGDENYLGKILKE